MSLDWQPADGWSGNWRGFDDGLLVASVSWGQDSQVGTVGRDGLRRPIEGPRIWLAFLAGHPVPGRWATAEEAQRAAEDAHDATAG